MRIRTAIVLALSVAACGDIQEADDGEKELETYALQEEETPEAEMITDADGDGHPAKPM